MIQVVLLNNFFIVCDKPAEVLSVPSRDRADKRPCLGTALQEKHKRQIFPVHRLDYEVSGLIMYAFDANAHRVAQSWFEKKIIKKKYSAVTSNQDFLHWPENVKTDRRPIDVVAGKEFYWKTQILKGKKRSFESEHGEWAETKAVIQKIENDLIYWILYPITGKSHQLRLELSRHGFPILGDLLYGSRVKNTQSGILLRAIEMDLSQVKASELVKFDLPKAINLPESCLNVI